MRSAKTLILSPLARLRLSLARDPEAAERRALARMLTQEARFFARVIEDRLERLNLCYRYKRSERDWLTGGVQRIRISEAHVSEQALYLKVDTARMPRGLRTVALEDPDVIHDLAVACKMPVSIKRGIRAGVWFIIERTEGVRGIPRMVRYADMIGHLPQDAPPLALPIGCGENNHLKYASLAEMPHMIVAGATGQGKSVFLNAQICTIVQRNPPERVRMIMVDLKGGVELSFYRGLPHLDAEIVSEKSDVLSTLETLCLEIDRRLNLFRDVCRDIGGWNYRHRKRPLPYYVLVIDELASIMLDRKLKRHAERLLEHIAARGRAPGVHSIVCTQRPSVNVITGIIKANYPVRVAFACADRASSQTIIDSGGAYQLTPQGRMIFAMGADKIELQGPLITDAMVQEIVADVIAGKDSLEKRARHDVTAHELFIEALTELDGDFNARELYRRYRKRGIGRDEVYAIGKEYAGQEIELMGAIYRLTDPIGPKCRKLVQIIMDENGEDVPSTVRVTADSETRYNPTDQDRDGETVSKALAKDQPEIEKNGPPFPIGRSARLPLPGEIGEAGALDWTGAACWYEDPLRQAVKDWKYRRKTEYLGEMAQSLIAWWLRDGVPIDVIVPVPLYSEREKERGFNQARDLARALAKTINVPCVEALARNRDTVPQADVRRAEFRAINVQAAFTVVDPAAIDGKRCLIVDDLMTTGATLGACCEALKGDGAAWVGGYALARPVPKAPGGK